MFKSIRRKYNNTIKRYSDGLRIFLEKIDYKNVINNFASKSVRIMKFQKKKNLHKN